jgi:spermidine synthase
VHELRGTPAPLLEVLGGIDRRPYPPAGIGDMRDTHILYESERAVMLMRRFEDPSEMAATGMSGEDMDAWRTQAALIEAGTPDWPAWLTSTFEVYRATASHIDVHETRWWSEVLRTAERDDRAMLVREAIELLDALARKDAPRLSAAVDTALAIDDYPLPPSLVTVAGVVALELSGAPASDRRKFVERHMQQLHNGTTNEDHAYQVIRAYALR